MRGRIFHHLSEDHCPRSGERTPSPPEMQGRGMTMADGLLAGAGYVDGLQGQGHFDQFFLGWSF